MEPAGSAPRTVMSEDSIGSVTVSPDGRYLVFLSKRSGEWDIWRSEINGGSIARLTTKAEPFPWLSVTPDSKWVLYTAGKAVWRVPIDGGEPVQFVAAPTYAYSPQLSPDGRFLACFELNASAGPQLFTFKVDGDDVTSYKTLTLPATFGANYRWAPNGQTIVYVDSIGRVSNLWQVAVDSGKAQQITGFDSEVIRNFAFLA
jgi:Tol biopolymer transport system component